MLKTAEYTEARDLLLARVEPLGSEKVRLAEATGRMLYHDLTAAENVPPFDRSPYDGYAFIAADTALASKENGVTLRILEEVPAGAVPTRTVTPGTAIKILTGAPLPAGADVICKYEDTRFTAEDVTLFKPYRAGDNIVRTGEDVCKGEVLAKSGTPLDMGLMGTLASQGIVEPEVFRKVRVGIISTGNEVIEADAALLPGKIRNSNRYVLASTLLMSGMEPVYLGLAGDATEKIAALITEGLAQCDAILLTGGASVGDYDLTPDAMAMAGVEVLVKDIFLKPGMACALGVYNGKPVLGLSGNPASAFTAFCCTGLPVLRKMAGWQQPVPEEITFTLRNDFSKKSPVLRALRGRLDLTGGTVGIIVPKGQGNAVISDTIGCNVMAFVPAGSGPLKAGTQLKGFVL